MGTKRSLGHNGSGDCKKSDVRLTRRRTDVVSWTIPTARMEFHRRLAQEKNLSGQLIKRLRGKFAPARCCITARANGIRGDRCALRARGVLAQRWNSNLEK